LSVEFDKKYLNGKLQYDLLIFGQPCTEDEVENVG